MNGVVKSLAVGNGRLITTLVGNGHQIITLAYYLKNRSSVLLYCAGVYGDTHAHGHLERMRNNLLIWSSLKSINVARI